MDDASLTDIRLASQWRLDFVTPLHSLEHDPITRQIIGTAEKILTRGSVTCLQPEIEAGLHALFPEGSSGDQDHQFRQPISAIKPRPWLDSDEETRFYNEFLPQTLGVDFARWVIPQTELLSLVPSEAEEFLQQRVDFFVSKPESLKLIIEIDGAFHEQQWELDNARDAALSRCGCTIFRIPVDEVRSGTGLKLDELRALLQLHRTPDSRPEDTNTQNRLVPACRYVHTIQIAILQAIQIGLLGSSGPWDITFDYSQKYGLQETEFGALVRLASTGMQTLLSRLAALYRFDLPRSTSKPLHLSFSGGTHPTSTVFHISSMYVPFDLAAQPVPSGVAKLTEPASDDLLYFLRFLFRKDEFWEGQADSITRVLQGKDVLVLLPTGAGKSITFQLASMLLPGVAVVVAPILSLIDDQIDNLRSYGINRVAKITSHIHGADRKSVADLFGQGHFLFCYVAPERFQTESFREALRALTVSTPVSLLAVDEAHCVSEWGHDFRTAYLNIGRTAREFCSFYGSPPPLIGLTGTASKAVLRDVQRELEITDFEALVTPKSFDRKELKLLRISCTSVEKTARMKGLLGQLLPREFQETSAAFFQARGEYTRCGVVFCPHVGGNFGIVQVAKQIEQALSIPTAIYSGTAPKGIVQNVYDEGKARTAHEFKRNRLSLLIATKSFGMGIDKSNVRYTIHNGLPSSIESFYQEAGRAGRDKRKAVCTILFSDDQPERTQRLLSPTTTIEEVSSVIDSVEWEDADDITRALWFHVNAFRGVEKELQDVEAIVDRLGDFTIRPRATIRVRKEDRALTEKALHRLLVLGLIADYSIDYSSHSFSILMAGASQEQCIEAYLKYLSGYLRAKIKPEIQKASALLGSDARKFILGMSQLLLRFVYEVIERGRRLALREMLAACKNEKTEDGFRSRILRYLDASAYSDDFEAILARDDAGLDLIQNIVDELSSPNQAAELRGQAGRYLESYPDHPSLLMLRALSEAYSRNCDLQLVKEFFLASLNSLDNYYGVTEPAGNQFRTWALSLIIRRDKSLGRQLTEKILHRSGTRILAREVLSVISTEEVDAAKWYLVARLADRVKSFLKTR
ncbi:MAG TPA: RecQ family ATP-dependent DNA helicase [Phycisphaerae bacterium]|nr:RecQ family ATP-dependent DNA helicase [Phycisphaerae bacterium]